MFFWIWAIKNWKPQRDATGDAGRCWLTMFSWNGQDWQWFLKTGDWCDDCVLFFLVGFLWRFGMLRTWFVFFCAHVAFVLQEIQEMMLVRWNSCVYHNSVQDQTYIIRSLIFIYTSHMLMQKIELKRTNTVSCLLWTAELEAHVISLQLISSWKQQLLLISKSFCYKKKSVGVIKPCTYMCMFFMFCLLRKNIINMFTKSWMNQK